MANQNLKDFTTNWVLLGLLAFALLSFALGFTSVNNPNAFGSASGVFTNTSNQLNSNLLQVPSAANNVSNVSAITQSLDTSGSAAISASTSYNFLGTGKLFWKSLINLISFVFSGTIGHILIGVLGGLVLYEAIYWIVTATFGRFAP